MRTSGHSGGSDKPAFGQHRPFVTNIGRTCGQTPSIWVDVVPTISASGATFRPVLDLHGGTGPEPSYTWKEHEQVPRSTPRRVSRKADAAGPPGQAATIGDPPVAEPPAGSAEAHLAELKACSRTGDVGRAEELFEMLRGDARHGGGRGVGPWACERRDRRAAPEFRRFRHNEGRDRRLVFLLLRRAQQLNSCSEGGLDSTTGWPSLAKFWPMVAKVGQHSAKNGRRWPIVCRRWTTLTKAQTI